MEQGFHLILNNGQQLHSFPTNSAIWEHITTTNTAITSPPLTLQSLEVLLATTSHHFSSFSFQLNETGYSHLLFFGAPTQLLLLTTKSTTHHRGHSPTTTLTPFPVISLSRLQQSRGQEFCFKPSSSLLQHHLQFQKNYFPLASLIDSPSSCA